jgi:Fe-S-cluster containining protein
VAETVSPSDELRVLQSEIDSRVQHIRSSVNSWPCAKGCDSCCRSLAALPQATEMEWRLIDSLLTSFPAEQRELIELRVHQLTEQQGRPIVCPFLDPSSGACLVYERRPLACRTYGFYVERDGGLFCSIIQEQLDCGMYSEVVWGNHAAIEHRSSQLGPSIDVLTWWNYFRASPAQLRKTTASGGRLIVSD